MLYLCLYYGIPIAIFVLLWVLRSYAEKTNNGLAFDCIGVTFMITLIVSVGLIAYHLKSDIDDQKLIENINEKQALLVDICSHVKHVDDPLGEKANSIKRLNEKLAKRKEANRGPWDYFVSDAVETTTPIRIISCSN